MPYGNFEDNYVTNLLYAQQQNQDPDLSVGEFIFDRLLRIGGLFEGDEDDDCNDIPFKSAQPIQSLQIQAGFLECCKPVFKIQVSPQPVAKPRCGFKENKFSREFPVAVFHPPACSC